VKRGATNVLDQYDFEVLRTWKVRGAILCETTTGIYILKEYNGRSEKLPIQNILLEEVCKHGFEQVEMLIRNKEGLFVTTEPDGSKYVIKTYVEGQECDVSNMDYCKKTMEFLGKYHNAVRSIPKEKLENAEISLQVASMEEEFEKHNRELKKVRRFLREKGQKNDFEHFLLQTYDGFLEQAVNITEIVKAKKDTLDERIPCHGDFQYHNILFIDNQPFFINFEKCIWDNATRDICYFLRKILEKHDWSIKIGEELLNAYEQVRPLSEAEHKQMYYRFLYPEKFWKIVNFYYNNGKAFIPWKTAEKLENILRQEAQKQDFIKVVLCR